MIKELNIEEVAQVGGGPLFVIPVVKIAVTMKAALVGGGMAAGIAGSTLASQDDS